VQNVPVQSHVSTQSVHSSLLEKTQILEIVYFWNFDTKFGFKSIELANWNSILINNVKNRGKVLFTVPHPSPNGTSVPVDSPWAYRDRINF
jgi:hypothetical protein